MSTSSEFMELTEQDMTQALCEVLMPRLREHILARDRGHCMRVANLDMDLMLTLCLALRRACPDAQIYILSEQHAQRGAGREEQEQNLYISSTRLVELRNPLPTGEQRAPLLVFLPANLQTSAEDSFGIATFEDIPVTGAYTLLLQRLMERVPTPLQGYVQDLLALPAEFAWTWADQVAQVRFLLTAIKNQVDGESLGASLYELGLVPDFHLFDDPALMQNRLRRNLESVRKLTHSDASTRGRVLELGLNDKVMQRRLMQFLADSGLVDPPIWTRQIVLNKQNRELSFDKWKFVDEINSDKIAIQVLDINIPEVSENVADERLDGLIGQRVLNPGEMPRFSVTFHTEPHPARVPSLDHFTVQIFTKSGEPIGGAKRVKIWTGKKQEQTVYLDKLNKLDFEDGWHFVRILPWTKDDEQVPLESPPRVNDERKRPHDSEDFYVLLEGEITEPPPRAIPWEASLTHARLRSQFKELIEERDPDAVRVRHIQWINKGSKTGKARQVLNEVIEVKFEHGGKFHINVSRYLKALEQATLSNPDQVITWHWSIKAGKAGDEAPQPDSMQWSRSAAVESFLDARARYCAALRTQTHEHAAITQAVELEMLKDEAIEYAEAYRDLLADLQKKIEQSRGTDQQKAIITLRTALAIDTVHMTLTDFRGRTKEAVLLGPTHPIRALWFTTWAQVGRQWLEACRKGPGEYITPTRDGLLSQLSPLNVPPALPCADGRVFTTIDNINPFWSLYASPSEDDARGLLGEICALLGQPEPAISGDSITAEILGARISRYLVQHPYIRTLSINAFNPGRATTLAEAIMQLQKADTFAQLRYDVRLFVPDPAMPHVGEALQELLSPDVTLSSDTVDVFSIPGRSHLFPKLSLAVHPLGAFYHHPSRYRAHLSMLFDVFPAEEIAAGPAFSAEDRSAVYGLLQDFATQFHDAEDGTFWRRQPHHGSAQMLPDMDDAIALQARLAAALSGAVATVATGLPAFEQRPIVTLSLNTVQRELIHHVHSVSDWVLTIDRHIGIEFFDHGVRDDREGGRERPEYLIDYTPGGASEQGYRLITTSRALLELETTLKPLLARYGLTSGQHETTLILNQLRALSGRLALKLISSPSHQAEALGLALARLFLIAQGSLSNQIILPLDVHLDLFQSIRRIREDVGDSVSLQRTDLALFDLNAATRTIRCNLVEVKHYSHVGGVSGYARLKDEITQQIEQSEDVLRRHFDPDRLTPDRPDRLLKTLELRVLLEFYLGRSERYKLIEPDAAAEARFLLTTLEDGYSLTFTRSALIFDFEKSGLDPVETEQGIEFYRIGRDQADALIVDATTAPDQPPQSRDQATRSIARLSSAAFIAPQRERTASRLDGPDRSRHLDSTDSTQSQDYEEIRASAPSQANTAVDAAAQNMFVPEDEPLPASATNGSAPLDGHEQQSAQSIEEPEEQDKLSEPMTALTGQPAAFPSENRLNGARQQQPGYSIILGAQADSPQYGILGESSGSKIALDLNQTHTISLFGVQGSGKSYTLGSIIEMACLPIPNVNVLPGPLATVVFHYSPTQDYKPEFTSMVYPNADSDQLTQLAERYGAAPQALKDMVLLVPAAKLEERKAEYPDIEVLPITFAASELKAVHWKFLMGAIGSQSMYMRHINLIMKKLRDKLTLDELRQEVENASMSDHLKQLARMRLQFAAEYIDDSHKLSEVIRPGRLIIVDIRDEFIEKDEALGLFVVLLQIFSEATYQGTSFNKLVVFDEAHKYIENPDLVTGLIEVVREMRHKGTSILVASQDPPSVPVSLIELSSQIILHRCNSPAWLKHIQKANSSLNNLTPEKMSRLGSGEAYIWSAKATDDGFTRGAIKIKCRPRVTQHGGATKTAVE